jgi:hypothetical protein
VHRGFCTLLQSLSTCAFKYSPNGYLADYASTLRKFRHAQFIHLHQHCGGPPPCTHHCTPPSAASLSQVSPALVLLYVSQIGCNSAHLLYKLPGTLSGLTAKRANAHNLFATSCAFIAPYTLSAIAFISPGRAHPS